MKNTILEKIVESIRPRLAASKAIADRSQLVEQAHMSRASRPSHGLRDALSDRSRINIIAEFKRASPSKGTIDERKDPVETALLYKAGGAAAISVLTEENYFNGSLGDLRAVRSAVELPILRKDFIFDTFQIQEAAAAGADAILLIASILSTSQISDLEAFAEDEFGMDAVIEVHSLDELERIGDLGSKIIGVNNRDLKSFDVSLNVSSEMIRHIPSNSLAISESGLSSTHDLHELRNLGFAGFLIGEALMRSPDPTGELRRLRDEG